MDEGRRGAGTKEPAVLRGTFREYVWLLAPFVLGLAFARIGQEALAIAMNGARYVASSSSVTTARAAALILLAAVLLVYGRRLPKRFVNRFAHFCIIGHLSCLVLLLAGAVLPFQGALFSAAYLVGNCLSVFSLFYWFRRLRGVRPALLVIAMGLARIIYEVYLGLAPFAPGLLAAILAAALLVAEFFCIQWSRKNGALFAAQCAGDQESFYITRNDKEFQELRFVLICLLACFFVSTAYDTLKTDPAGGRFYANATVQVAASLICCAFLAYAALTALRGKSLLKITYGLVGILVLAAVATFLFAILPDFPQPGVACIAAANSLKDALKWYFIVAFMSIGKRDPYLYAAGIWLVFMVPIVLDRLLLGGLEMLGIPPSSALFYGWAALNLTLAASLFMMCFARLVVQGAESAEVPPSPLLKNLIGAEAPPTMDAIKRGAMGSDIAAMGSRFFLSERECEIAALYALGHTQAAIAEELCISKTTVHTHIGHIYEKTGLHSRQDIINYLKDYGI